jgi:uncharacterized protein YbjT (DUF2867 family)
MPHVAIPGGTSPGLGRSIVTALSRNPANTVTVLSRETSATPQWLSDLDVEVKKVDYADEDGLVLALRGSDTVSFLILTYFFMYLEYRC